MPDSFMDQSSLSNLSSKEIIYQVMSKSNSKESSQSSFKPVIDSDYQILLRSNAMDKRLKVLEAENK
jgi:hypothetical protein